MSSLSPVACESFLQAQLAFTGNEILKRRMDAGRPAVTLSRQVGARGRTIGQKLRDELDRVMPGEPTPWALFDRDLARA